MHVKALLKVRRIVVFLLMILATVEIISGIILFLPELGIDLEWVFETIPRSTLKSIHELISYPLITVVGIHLTLNWKIIKRYPKTLLKQPLRKVTSLILIVLGAVSATTGLLLRFYFIGGGGFGRGRGAAAIERTIPTLLGLVKSDFILIHSYISLAILALLVVHIIINRRLIGYYIRGPKKSRNSNTNRK